MAVKIELKRSAVPGKVPTTGQLDLGELAINTYDGTVYFKQDNGVTQSIVQLTTTAGSGSSVESASYATYAATAGSTISASYSLTASYFNGTTSYAATSSLPLLGIVTASVNASVITFTKGDETTFDIVVAQSGSVESASYALFAQNAATASYVQGLDLTTYQISTGSITASVDVNPANLFLIKSGSTNYFNIASDSTVTSYSNLFIIKNFTTQQPVFTVNSEIMLVATQSATPTVSNGGFWFTATDLYIGIDDGGVAP